MSAMRTFDNRSARAGWLLMALLLASIAPLSATQIATGDDVVREARAGAAGQLVRMAPMSYMGMPVLLAHSAVAPETVQVRVNGMTLRPGQYKIAPGGAVVLDAIVPRGARVDVVYRAAEGAELRNGFLAPAVVTGTGDATATSAGTVALQQFAITPPADQPRSLLERGMVRNQPMYVYGAAFQGLSINGVQMDYGRLGAAPSGVASFQGFSNAGSPGLLSPEGGPQATWAGVSLSDPNSIVKGYYRRAEFDADWTPAEAQGDLATVNAMRAYGFADKNDMLNPAANRTLGAQFAGTKWEDWMLQATPVRGLVVSTQNKTQEDRTTLDRATMRVNSVAFDSGGTHAGYSTMEQQVKHQPLEADPKRQTDTVAKSDTLRFAQGVVLNGKQAVLGFTRTRSHSEDKLTGLSSPETTQTQYSVDQVQVLPFLNLGCSKARTAVDDEVTPGSERQSYMVNELRLSDGFALQGGLIKDFSFDNPDPTFNGMKTETLTVKTPDGQRVWLLTDKAGLTSGLYTRVTNEFGEKYERRLLAGDAKALGFTVTGSYDREKADYQLNPLDRETRVVTLSRELSSHTTVSLTDSRRLEWGAEFERRRIASAMQKVGDLQLTATGGVLETASGATRPEAGLRGSFREDQPTEIRGGFALVKHADTDNALGLDTHEIRGAVPIGPVTLRGSYRENPELSVNGAPTAIEGEQKSVGLDVAAGGMTLSVDRVENPTIMTGNTEQFLGKTSTDLKLSGQLSDHGALTVGNRFIDDKDNAWLTNSLTLDFSYKHASVGDISLLFYHNAAWRGHGNLPLGQGYRLRYGRQVSDDFGVSLDVAKSFASISALTDGLPTRDTRVFLEMRQAF